jgi:hypothetical protein
MHTALIMDLGNNPFLPWSQYWLNLSHFWSSILNHVSFETSNSRKENLIPILNHILPFMPVHVNTFVNKSPLPTKLISHLQAVRSLRGFRRLILRLRKMVELSAHCSVQGVTLPVDREVRYSLDAFWTASS